MEINEAFDKALNQFDISAASVARRSGISPSEISRFRKGHADFYAGRLMQLLKGLPMEVAIYCVMTALRDNSASELSTSVSSPSSVMPIGDDQDIKVTKNKNVAEETEAYRVSAK